MEITRQDLENIPISYCRGCRSTVTIPITIGEALKRMSNGLYSRQTAIYRNEGLPKDIRDKAKQELDAFLFSGEFSRRSAANMETYSKIAIFDIDDVSDCSFLKEQFRHDPFIIATWTSISGKGVKGLVCFDYSEVEKLVADKEDTEINWSRIHSKTAFEQLIKYFKEKYCIELDLSGRDVSRLCFGTYDPDLIIKDSASTFSVNPPATSFPEKKRREKLKTERMPVSYDEKAVFRMERRDNQLARRQMTSIIKYLRKRKISITSTYFDWYIVGQAIANTFSYSVGRKYYLDLCSLDGERHDEAKSIKKINECYSNDDPNNEDVYVGFASIVRKAKEKGWYNRAESTDAEKD